MRRGDDRGRWKERRGRGAAAEGGLEAEDGTEGAEDGTEGRTERSRVGGGWGPAADVSRITRIPALGVGG